MVSYYQTQITSSKTALERKVFKVCVSSRNLVFLINLSHRRLLFLSCTLAFSLHLFSFQLATKFCFFLAVKSCFFVWIVVRSVFIFFSLTLTFLSSVVPVYHSCSQQVQDNTCVLKIVLYYQEINAIKSQYSFTFHYRLNEPNCLGKQ